MRITSLLALALVLTAPPAPATVSAATPAAGSPKAVLVTGASTGIGRKITERLAADGYFVYAGARKDADLAALDAIENVQAIRLDVTKSEDIAAAVETVTKAGRGLWALVNNAGVAITGPILDTKEEDLALVMDVNAYGPLRMTKAFIPLIADSKGRIVTISSIAGILSSGTLGAYSMSKHAVESFGDSLALQLEPTGVKVSLIEPGEVAEAVEQALFDPNPKRRYLVVSEQAEAEATIRKAIEVFVQLNEGHAYTYDRDALVRMLDEAQKTSRPATPMPASAAASAD